MSSRESIYVSSGADVTEMARGIRLCLRADWASVPEVTLPEAWTAWLARGHWQALAAHMVKIYALAATRDWQQITTADCALSHGLCSLYGEMEALPTTNDSLRKRLLRAAGATTAQGEPQMPGRMATFCAVAAQQAFLPLIVALQSGFFLEWRARQNGLPDATAARFLTETADFSHQLRSYLTTHAPTPESRFHRA